MNTQEKWQHLVHRTNKAQMVAIIAGIEPTEVWLGPEEMEELAEYRRYAERMGFTRSDPTTTETKLLGLRVMGSLESGIRVGTTFTPPES